MENLNLWMCIILNRMLLLYIQLFDYSRRYWKQSLCFFLTVVKEVGASLQELREESSRPDGLSDFHGGGFPWMWHSLGSYGQSEPPLSAVDHNTRSLCRWLIVCTVCPLQVLMSMYQKDILEEDVIMRWFTQGAASEKSQQLRQNQGVGFSKLYLL